MIGKSFLVSTFAGWYRLVQKMVNLGKNGVLKIALSGNYVLLKIALSGKLKDLKIALSGKFSINILLNH